MGVLEEAVLYTTMYVLSENIKNIIIFLVKFSIFTAEKFLYIAWACFRNVNWGLQGYIYFSYFSSKNTLGVLEEAVLYTTMYVLSVNIKNIIFFLVKFSIFTADNYIYIAWACFRNVIVWGFPACLQLHIENLPIQYTEIF